MHHAQQTNISALLILITHAIAKATQPICGFISNPCPSVPDNPKSVPNIWVIPNPCPTFTFRFQIGAQTHRTASDSRIQFLLTKIPLLLGEEGSLRLYNGNYTVWESVSEPSDTLLPWQILREDAQLVTSASSNNWSRGQYHAEMTSKGFFAFVQAADVQLNYLHLEQLEQDRTAAGQTVRGTPYPIRCKKLCIESIPMSRMTAAVHDGKNLGIYIGETSYSYQISFESADASYHYLRLDFDGHLRTYRRQKSNFSKEIYDLVARQADSCQVPNVCGDYGICNRGGKCSCPKAPINGSDYFKQTELGCAENVPLSCQSPLDLHHQLEENVGGGGKEAANPRG